MSIAVRPAHAADAESLAWFYRTLSPRSRLRRFLGAVNQLPLALVARFASNDQPGEKTLLAVLVGGAADAIVGEARYVVAPDGRRAEFALAVADAAQGIGVGRRLLLRLMHDAIAHGVEVLYGDVLADNEAMLGLARSLGFTESRSVADARLRRIEVRPARFQNVDRLTLRRDPSSLRSSG